MIYYCSQLEGACSKHHAALQVGREMLVYPLVVNAVMPDGQN
jgi:hypothetical protein